MPDEFTQEKRFLFIKTPLKDQQGNEILLINNFNVSEGLSRLFVLELELIAELRNVNSVHGDALIGQAVSLTVNLRNGKKRFFHGIISRFSEGEEDERFRYYRAQAVPWLWLLTLTSNCRIFPPDMSKSMSVPDIVIQIVKERGFSDFLQVDLTKSYTERDYCLQYRETDFNFISRLMEDEGIFYFFKHEENKHIMVLADSTQPTKKSCLPCPNQPSARYSPTAGFGEEEDTITAWQMTEALRPGKYALRDHHFEMSGKTLEDTESSIFNQKVNSNLEVYDYPGDYAEKFNKTGERLDQVQNEARKIVRLRMEEEETSHLVYTGASYCRDFNCGFRFDLTGHPSNRMNGSKVLTSIQHSAVQSPPYVSGRETVTPYHNTFTCIPQGTSFRPARITPKPVVQGAQTAEVVGPKGEEIYTDKYGRVKVQFHWDREHKKDEKSSCWIRVAQFWAGKQWGAIFIPRIGQEVVVDFLEGDPDRPIIVGSVYNNLQMPPYTLPANQTQSGIKSRSSKGGGTANFNEIRFEDKKGQEEVYIHAERNLTTVVEASESRSVGGSRTTTIQKDETLTIKEGNRTETLEKGNDTLTLKQGNRTTTLDQGNDTLKVTMGNITIEAPAGKYSVSAKDVEITGTTSVKIVCGGSSIEMTPATITIKSPTIEINGSALTTVKGGLVKINC